MDGRPTVSAARRDETRRETTPDQGCEEGALAGEKQGPGRAGRLGG